MSGPSSILGRLLRIITLIQGSGWWTTALLADELKIGERTVYRDLKRLKDGGIPVEYDQVAKSYRMRAGFFLPPVDLTPEEACALLLLGEGVGKTDQLPLTRPAQQAVQKLRALLPVSLREPLDELMPNVDVRLAASEAGDGIDDLWSTISAAIRDRRALRCTYDAAHPSDDGDGNGNGSAHEAFRLDPYALHFGQRAWYVIGHHHGRDELRTLRLIRFRRVEPTDKPFGIPDDFSVDTFFGQAWRMVPGDRRRHRVQLRFAPPVADTVEETIWHATQQTQEHGDGSLTVWFEIDGLDEIVWWILGYGPHCVVEQPAELREKVAELVKAMAERYH